MDAIDRLGARHEEVETPLGRPSSLFNEPRSASRQTERITLREPRAPIAHRQRGRRREKEAADESHCDESEGTRVPRL